MDNYFNLYRLTENRARHLWFQSVVAYIIQYKILTECYWGKSPFFFFLSWLILSANSSRILHKYIFDIKFVQSCQTFMLSECQLSRVMHNPNFQKRWDSLWIMQKLQTKRVIWKWPVTLYYIANTLLTLFGVLLCEFNVFLKRYTHFKWRLQHVPKKLGKGHLGLIVMWQVEIRSWCEIGKPIM